MGDDHNRHWKSLPLGLVTEVHDINSMKNENIIIIVLVGILLTSELKEGQHIDHVPETTHEVQSSLIVPYAWNGTITGSFRP